MTKGWFPPACVGVRALGPFCGGKDKHNTELVGCSVVGLFEGLTRRQTMLLGHQIGDGRTAERRRELECTYTAMRFVLHLLNNVAEQITIKQPS